MGDVLEPAATGRAKCRGCGEKIEKGSLRFGEAVETPFGDAGDQTTAWFHLLCAADRRPEKLHAQVRVTIHELPERERLEALIAQSIENPKLRTVRRAERSPTGRATCQECREKIEKGTLRLAIEREGDIPSMNATSFIHARCAKKHVGSLGLAEKLRRTSSTLGPADLEELLGLIAG